MSWLLAAGTALTVGGSMYASRQAKKGMDASTAASWEAVESQERIANRQFEMEQSQFDYMKNRQTEVDRVAEEVTRRQLAMAEETTSQGRDLYNYQKDVFRPVEQALVSEAMRESTPAYYEQYAQKAVASQAAANANAQGQMERNMASMGVNPNSGAWMSSQRGLQLTNAAGLGAVANDSRDKAEALGWARRAEVSGLGKGLVGAGNASYGLAAASNSAATGATNAANAQAINGLGSPAQYGQLAISGMNSAMNGYQNIYENTERAMERQTKAINDAASAMGGLVSQYGGSRGGGGSGQI